MTRPLHVVSCSEGKDSVATILLAAQHGEPMDEAAEMKKAFLAEKAQKVEKQPNKSVLAKLKEHTQAASEKAVKKPEQEKKPKSKEMEI